MQGVQLDEATRIKLKIIYSDFLNNLVDIYPKTPIYGYFELIKWYNENLPYYFVQTALKYDMQVRCKFNIISRQLVIIDASNTHKLMTININMKRKLKEINHQQYNIERGFIFPKKESEDNA